MKLKLGLLLSARPVLEYLYTQRLTGKGSFVVKRNVSKINPELEGYQKAYGALLEEYGKPVKGKEDDYREVSPENKVKFLKELDGILSQEVELDLTLLSVEDLTCKLSAAELELIDWMIGGE